MSPPARVRRGIAEIVGNFDTIYGDAHAAIYLV